MNDFISKTSKCHATFGKFQTDPIYFYKTGRFVLYVYSAGITVSLTATPIRIIASEVCCADKNFQDDSMV